MSHTIRHRLRIMFAILTALTFATTGASARAAQSQPTDPRWTPWLGCWASDQAGAAVCVIPTARAAAVELVTIAKGQIVLREVVDASGAQLDRISEGCSGWESGRWADDGRRLYLRSEYRCGAGAARTGTELFAISPAGEWLDSVSVTIGQNTGVRTTRRHLSVPAVLPVELASSISPRPALRSQGVIAPVGFAEILEATRHLDAPVVEAWLAVVKPELTVDARRLVDLSRSGVPDRIIDAIVALAYPGKFHVEAPAAAPPIQPLRSNVGQVVVVEPAPVFVVEPAYVRYPAYDCRFESHSWDRCNGWRPAQDVIVITGTPLPPPPHGRVTKEGYQSGEKSNNGRQNDTARKTDSEPAPLDSSNTDPNKKPAPAPTDPEPQRTARPR